MAFSRTFTALGAVLAGTLMFTACSGGGSGTEIKDASADFGFQETGFPIVSKQLDLTFSGTKAALAPDYNTMTVVKEWEKATNVHIKWENLPETVFQEKKNLIL
ncbi:MAG: sugar transporter substrate-binding protein, partial [Pseudarthrobacter sp.]|nr:sugar transporter substrate-binding protein [Pseudarthrobacter sp.]